MFQTKPRTDADIPRLKAGLATIVKNNAASRTSKCPLPNEHKQALKELQANKEIRILKPGKACGVLVMSNVDYVRHMEQILSDSTKFHVDPNQSQDMSNLEKELNEVLMNHP